MFPFGFHSFRAAAFRLSSDRFVIVRLASVKIIERSNGLHEEIGTGVGAGAPLESHKGGEAGTETLVAKNSHVPLKFAPDLKYVDRTVKPFPVVPGAKRLIGVARPEGERMRLSRV